MDFLLLAVAIFLVVKIVTLQGRVKKMERIVPGLVQALQAARPMQARSASPIAAEFAPTPEPLSAPLFAASDATAGGVLIPDVTPALDAAPSVSQSPPQSQRVVFTLDVGIRLMRFLRENWVYVVSAASLALAGVFLVQYGVERGFVPPVLRVLAAIALGMVLIAGGEYLRRRFGDAPDSSVTYLPATFSGAGIVSIFAGVMAARHLYGLIGPDLAMGGYVVTALGAVALGWFNGSLLMAVGLVGAAAAPFLVGGDAEAAPWLYLYFALVGAMGIGVDTVRRWGWVSVLALFLAFAGAGVMRQYGAGAEGWILFLIGLPVLATALPDRSLWPRHEGPALIPALLARRQPDRGGVGGLDTCCNVAGAASLSFSTLARDCGGPDGAVGGGDL